MSDEEEDIGGFGGAEEEEEEEGGLGFGIADEEDEEFGQLEEEEEEEDAGGFGGAGADKEENQSDMRKVVEKDHGDVGFNMAPRAKPVKVKKEHEFVTFAKKWFKHNNTPGYQLEPIQASLLNVGKGLQKKATLIFVHVCRWMGITAKVGKSTATTMQTAAMIVTPGIIHEALRDEIMCQILKQMTNNPAKASRARGVILLTLVLGCFVPSEKMLPVLRQFINDGPPGFAVYQNLLLRRTEFNGARSEPPCTLELQAAKRKQFLRVEVIVDLRTKRTSTARLDPASVCSEWVQEIAMKEGIKDLYGFTILVERFGRLLSLRGADEKGLHVMDVISKVDKSMQGQTDFSDIGGQLSFRKEVYKPDYNAEKDPKGAMLIYHQLQVGLREGTYVCSDQDYNELSALMYYVQFGDDVDSKKLEQNMKLWLPEAVLLKEPAAKRVPKVEKINAKAEYVRKSHSRPAVQGKFIDYFVKNFGQANTFGSDGSYILVSNAPKTKRPSSSLSVKKKK